MSLSDAVARFLRGEELPVAVDQIENELGRLWQTVPVEHKLVRECRLNLLVQMSSPALIDQTAAVVREFSKHHPCRVLMLVLNPNSEEEELAASVVALCAPQSAGQKTASGEQILIIASGQSVQQVPGLAFPLVLPGLPSVYWFVQGIPAETPLLEHVLANKSHVIIDSSTVDDLGLTLARANAVFDKATYLGDLNWQRLAPWLAQLEEILVKPEVSSLAAKIEKVSLTIGGEALDENQIAQPVLLLSWLAQRFGWELVETLDYINGTFRAVWRKAEREIVAEIKNIKTAEKDLSALEIVVRSEQEPITLKLARAANSAGVVLETMLFRGSQNLLQQRSQPLVSSELAQTLLHEYAQKAHDNNYADTLLMATKLI